MKQGNVQTLFNKSPRLALMVLRLGMVAAGLLLGLAAHADKPTGTNTTFAQAAKNIGQGVFLVGLADGKGHGTAWVISKKHRLLATNAHVADLYYAVSPGQFRAIRNGSVHVYTVERVWYHPGVRRYLTNDENLSARSTDPKVGKVNPLGPDVAVLQLAADGPDLPVELKVADPQVLFNLQAARTGMMGYPGHDTLGWPRPGKKVLATFHEGTVSRVTDFNLEDPGREEAAQLLQYTMETYGGFSGSPIFLASGEVVGLNNMARRVQLPGQPERTLAHGIRADSLWELLAFHKLEERVTVPVPSSQLLLARWSQPDPAWDLFRRLKKILNEAQYLIHTKLDFAGGIAKCDQAVKLYPRFAEAYDARSSGFNNWYFHHGKNWPVEKKVDILKKALEDVTIYNNLHRQLAPQGLLRRLPILNNLYSVTKDRIFLTQSLDDVNQVLSLKNLSHFQQASALSHKGACLAHLDKAEAAEGAHNQALQMLPDEPWLWDNRASFFSSRNPKQAKADRAMANALRKKKSLLQETGKKDLKTIYNVNEHLTSNDSPDERQCYRQAWAVQLEAGMFYQIDLKSIHYSKGKGFDPVLRLTNDQGEVLWEDDDGGGFPHARIFFTPARTGKYTLTVTSYQPRQTGQFALSVLQIARERHPGSTGKIGSPGYLGEWALFSLPHQRLAGPPARAIAAKSGPLPLTLVANRPSCHDSLISAG